MTNHGGTTRAAVACIAIVVWAFCVVNADAQNSVSSPSSATNFDTLKPVGGVVHFESGLDARDFVRATVASPADDGTPEALALTIEDSMRLRYRRITFFPTSTLEDGTTWLVVDRMTVHPSDQFQVRTAFTNSRNCPAVIDILALAEQLKMPVIDLPDVPAGSPPMRDRANRFAPDTSVHGVDYKIAARSFFYDTDALAQTIVWGSDNTPLAAWARTTISTLEPCWASQL